MPEIMKPESREEFMERIYVYFLSALPHNTSHTDPTHPRAAYIQHAPVNFIHF